MKDSEKWRKVLKDLEDWEAVKRAVEAEIEEAEKWENKYRAEWRALAESLISTVAWRNSKKGHTYWSEIYENMRKEGE